MAKRSLFDQSLRTVLLLVGLAAVVSRGELTDEYLHLAPSGYGPDPSGVPDSFKCAWRKLAVEYAQQLRPDSVQKVSDALQVESMCGNSESVVGLSDAISGPAPPRRQRLFQDVQLGGAVYVDANAGDDSNPGSEDKPKKTIHAAVDESRMMGAKPVSIILRKGTYFLGDTVHLGPGDSLLSFEAYPGEQAWISGGIPLTPSWQPYHPGTGSDAASTNIYVADLGESGPPEITGLRIDGRRVPRARRPNADPERDLFPNGWFPSSTANKWLPKKDYGPAKQVTVPSPVRNVTGMFLNYAVGIGGPCENFSPPVSYWCQEHPAGGGGFQYYVPSGMVVDKSVFSDTYGPVHGTWKNASGAVAQVWRRAHWSSWMFEVDSFDPDTNTMSWTKGGFQGSRGGTGSDWYIEGVLDELDAPGEWYYDATTKHLYYYHNATAGTPPPANLSVVATQVKILFNATGSQKSPVQNVSFSGIGFRDSAYTYLDPHGVPSGGDWGLERMGALFFEGTEQLMVANCTFERLDGNGIMLSGYNRNATIADNEFAWTGSSAMAAWGRTDELSDSGIHGLDGTTGDYPRYTLVTRNLVRETGIYEKQSSAWFQAKSAQTTLSHNVIFNLARAGININDGFGGGNEIFENLIFHTCRESSDHGPINSWDRQPFLTTVRTGQPSLIPDFNIAHNNFIVSNYGGVKSIDNDDGSIFWNHHENFIIYGWGLKNGIGCGGHKSYSNVALYADLGYRGHTNFKGHEEYRDQIYNETWVFGNGTHSFAQEGSGCEVTKEGLSPSFVPPDSHDNSLFHPADGKLTISCGRKGTYSVQEWQQQTHEEKGTTVTSTLPSDEELMDMGRKLLGMSPKR